MSRLITRVVILLLPLGCGASSLSADDKAAEKPTTAAGQLSALLKVAAPIVNPWPQVDDPLKSDEQHPDRTSFVVPAGLRDLVKGEGIVEGWSSITCSFHTQKARPSWEWCSQFEFKGARDNAEAIAVQKRLLEHAKRAGFTESKRPEDLSTLTRDFQGNDKMTVFRRATDKIEEIVAWTPMAPLVGGRPPTENGTMEFSWAVRSLSPAPPPTYADLVRALSCMEVRHDGEFPIPNWLVQMLRPQQVTEALVAGRGTNDYCLILSLVANPKKEKDLLALEGTLSERLCTEKFKRSSFPPGKGDLYFRKGDDLRNESCDVYVLHSKEGLEIMLGLNFARKADDQ